MKRKYYILSILLLSFFSCSKHFLDETPDQDLSLKDVFTNRLYTQSFLTSIYAGLPNEIDPPDMGSRAPWTGTCDEMEITYPGCYSHYINHGAWTPQNIEDNWQWEYQDIRKTDIFLENINMLQLQNGYSQQDKNAWTGEALFLRAYCHFLVFRLYGPIAIMNSAAKPDQDFTTIKRSPLDSCVASMVKDCDDAAALLAMKVTSDKTGRATKAGALALKARILLYSASPLFNGNPDYVNFSDKKGLKLFPQSYDNNKWQLAAQAAKDCIDQCEAAGYKLYEAPGGDPLESYSNLFLVNNNSEVLWAQNCAYYNHMEFCQSPLSYGGYSIMSVSQDLVDAYQDSLGRDVITGHNPDGTPEINTQTGYTEDGFTSVGGKYWNAGISNMYAGREPRFYASVHYSGETWKSAQVQTWFNGKDGASKNGTDYSKTGYVMKKFADPTINIPQNTGWGLKTWILFRLGEIYLDYAEALNEFQGPVTDVYKYVNAIRNRAGLPDLQAGLSKDEMRQKIWHERRVELAFEGHRYFDCRRWKIASQTNNGNLYGLNIKKGNSLQDPSFYKRTPADVRVFSAKRDYLWPIPQSEIDKDTSLVQNPFW